MKRKKTSFWFSFRCFHTMFLDFLWVENEAKYGDKGFMRLFTSWQSGVQEKSARDKIHGSKEHCYITNS